MNDEKIFDILWKQTCENNFSNCNIIVPNNLKDYIKEEVKRELLNNLYYELNRIINYQISK